MLLATTGIIVKSGMPRNVPAKERNVSRSNDRFEATNANPSFSCAIIDADVSKVTEFMGDKPHPGKDRTSGHFGFAGHNDPVAFRNVQIKRLDKKD